MGRSRRGRARVGYIVRALFFLQRPWLLVSFPSLSRFGQNSPLAASGQTSYGGRVVTAEMCGT